ncbi:MAG: ribbon-helix-helix protein, CopG family [Acidimicrobiales bacterium]
MRTRRTTVTADEAAFRILQAEADRRAVTLSEVLRQAVEEKAQSLRSKRRPQVGVARSTDGQRAAEVTADPVADPVKA